MNHMTAANESSTWFPICMGYTIRSYPSKINFDDDFIEDVEFEEIIDQESTDTD